MKFTLLFLLFSNYVFCQSFGSVEIALHPMPKDERDMDYYKWYNHPKENSIFIKSFELSLNGFMMAFSEAEKLLAENELEFSQPLIDASHFHPEIKQSHTFEDLHQSISKNESKIHRTWNVNGDYLSLLIQNDVYMLILGNKRSD